MTYTGERYYESVKQMMRLEENIKKEFQDIKNQESGCLRLGVAFWRGACLLPDIFPEFHRQYPGIRIELMEDHSDKLALALMNGKLDIAVMNLPHTLDYRKLTSDIIFEERILLAALHGIHTSVPYWTLPAFPMGIPSRLPRRFFSFRL